MVEDMNVLYQFNDKYAPYAGVSITSLFINNKDTDITVWILGEDISSENIDKLTKTAEKYGKKITFIDDDRINTLIEKMKSLNMPTYRGSYAANMRMFLSDILPGDVDRVLYLDADTIVRRDLTELYTMVLGEDAIAMVQDSLGESHKVDLGLSSSDKYYNSGVILFDMNRWNELGLTDRIVEHVTNVRAQYPSPDQDLINVVCHKYIHCIGPEYNFQPMHRAYKDKQYYKYYGKTEYYSIEEIAKARSDARILHFFRFVGEFPWDANNVHPYSDIFDKYLEHSMWSDYKKKPADNGMVMKIEKVMYRVLPRGLFLWIFSLSHQMFYQKANKMSENNKISKDM